MDEHVHNIEKKLLFVLLAQHTAFNGQVSIGVGRRICAREFAPSGDKPPPADCSIELLNVPNQKAADFVLRYGISRFPHRRPAYRGRAPPLQSVFAKKQTGGKEYCEIIAKVIMR